MPKLHTKPTGADQGRSVGSRATKSHSRPSPLQRLNDQSRPPITRSFANIATPHTKGQDEDYDKSFHDVKAVIPGILSLGDTLLAKTRREGLQYHLGVSN